ncbi:methionine synthase [Corynebacterium sp. MSK041]|uniref:methionine synthase n=1 Tax=Corynebacterium sp. MSK041 TaxID=3050194 RepID=UPI00254DA285|nr:methionine synthase [Corynebacterium sp. MSK041]MDK8794719.1 methionine synthase [Corynebacterium sp. MSK041]
MTAFGLGPMPGTDLVQAADVVLSELPTPHLPQLPARGVGSDLIGRTAALLPLNLDIGPRSWRVTRRPQIATMRARDQFERDLDLLEELWAGKLTELKVQLVGPWTLAAQLEMANGHRMITDRGATREIAEALVYAAGEHRSDVEKRFGVSTLLQLDEPALTRVRGGTLTGTTDYEDIPAVTEERLLAAYEPFGEHLLNTPDPLYAADWFTVNLAGEFEWDALAGALDRGARIAVPVMEPRDVFNIFDQLQIDPALTTIDVYGEAGPTLLDTAAKFSAATEMAAAVATVD